MNQRKRQIIEVAHRLFLEKGFQATSIKDILENAKIAKGTFYNHFASKNDCLIAILELVRSNAQEVREELALGKAKDDEDVFIEQVLVRMKMNREQNLLPLFESVFHSKDPDLKVFMKKYFEKELIWISQRIIDVLGEKVRKYALDYACIFLGTIQQMIHVWMLGTKKSFEFREMTYFALNKLKAIAKAENQDKRPFFPSNWLSSLETNEGKSVEDLKTQLITKLKILLTRMESEQEKQETIKFLYTELQTNEPRIFLIESVLLYIEEKMTITFFTNEIRDIIDLTQQYLHHSEKKKSP
ncbi:TetR/AcrR family transcriptional regulator [Bacillus niameyensis]|uniref:TetR/AcrR family transcriptional regulator n=1 Tax=Bacillus niameyensis TaxID=1522308 RepID=UPI0007843188|nr:TetR/AcrR family transcriptional regulator [Bacillus niameyensis]